MSDFDAQSSDTRLNELSDLLSLAEKSADRVDALSDILSRRRNNRLVSTVLIYFLLAGCGFYWFYKEPSTVLWIVVNACVVSSAYAMYLIRVGHEMSKITRELELEMKVQSRLVAMIHDQFNFVKLRQSMSPVNEALMQIRMMRVGRGMEGPN